MVMDGTQLPAWLSWLIIAYSTWKFVLDLERFIAWFKERM